VTPPEEALRQVPEFAAALADAGGGAAFAAGAHSRLLAAVSAQLERVGETLAPARTSHSDEQGRLVQRNDGTPVRIYTQVLRRRPVKLCVGLGI
jgi:hypothetical protein